MKIFCRLFLLLILLILCSVVSIAQDQQPQKIRIETVDGNEYTGVILEKTNEKIRLKTENLGEITIRMSDVVKQSPAIEMGSALESLWPANPQATRYFWAPNGYNLKKGEGYYQNVWVLFNQISYGITDHFSAGLGVIPTFLFGGSPTPAWVTAKVSLPVVENKFNLGAGVLAGTVIGEANTSFGIVYGISTLGTKDKNLNLGLGWGFADGEFGSTPLISFGGMIRTGAKGYLITENYLITNSNQFALMAMLGGRRMIKLVGLDYGFVVPLGSDINTLFAIPWLGITVPF